jgi:hypothetical protein
MVPCIVQQVFAQHVLAIIQKRPTETRFRRLPRTSLSENIWARHRILRDAGHSGPRIPSARQLRLRVSSRYVLPISIGLQRYCVRPLVRRCVHSPECRSPEIAQLPHSIALHQRKSASGVDAIRPHIIRSRIEMNVPVVVYRARGEGPQFYENTQTLVIGAHGALVTLTDMVTPRQKLQVQNPESGEHLECRVVSVKKERIGPPTGCAGIYTTRTELLADCVSASRLESLTICHCAPTAWGSNFLRFDALNRALYRHAAQSLPVDLQSRYPAAYCTPGGGGS